nr:MAG TPA: hypothetical protein [Bacteriophage sp.]
MDVVKFLKEKYRMTKKSSICCADCPLDGENNTTGLACGTLQGVHPEIAVSIVEKWSAEHPQETRFTYFLKCFPNAILLEDGVPLRVCPHFLGICKDKCSSMRNCKECWNRPLGGE